MTIVHLNAPSKYRAKRTAGFASQAEARRGAELELLEKSGKIRNLVRQPRFVLLPAAPELGYKRPLVYKLDFQYYDVERDLVVREEVKGCWTDAARIKVRMTEQMLGLPITIIRAK